MTIKDQGGIPTEPFTTPICTYTARLMSKLASPENTHFQFSLGDNFYDDGVVNVEDTRFQDSFEKVFTDDHTMDTPWFFNLGLTLGTRNLNFGFNFGVKIEFLIYLKVTMTTEETKWKEIPRHKSNILIFRNAGKSL